MKTPPPIRFSGFTLVELLTVIAIIAVLMGLLFPATRSVMNAARGATAKTDITQLVTAINAYYTEYGKLPTATSSPSDASEATQGWFQGPQSGGQYNSQLVRVLAGENHNGLNSRKIVFLEVKPAKGEDGSWRGGVDEDFVFYDPWGTPYGIKMDTSYNGIVEYYGTNSESNLRTLAIAISFGRNGIQQDPYKSTDKGESVDDIVSFL